MYKQKLCGLVILLTFSAVSPDDFTSQNEVLDYDHDHDPVIYGIRNDSVVYPSAPKDTWLESARNALAGPAGRIVVTMAKEMIARSTGNSQVIRLVYQQTNAPKVQNATRLVWYITDFEPEFNQFADIGVAESANICCWIGWCWELGSIWTCSEQ